MMLKTVIKSLGLYRAEVRLHAEVPVAVTINVARSEEEARLQEMGTEVTTETGDGGAQAVDIEEIFEQTPSKESLALETAAAADTDEVALDERATVPFPPADGAVENS